MKKLLLPIITVAILVGWGKPVPPSIELWKAVADGNLESVKQHIAAGSELNGKEATGGSTPLILASIFGEIEAARALIDGGVSLDIAGKASASKTPQSSAEQSGGESGNMTSARNRRN